MRWEVRAPQGGDNYRRDIVLLNSDLPNGKEYVRGALKFQGWGFNACSTAFVWGWNGIPSYACNEEALAGFIAAYEDARECSSWNPHMFFAQVPGEGKCGPYNDFHEESPFFKFFRETIYPDLKPVFTYDNRAHASTEQRLFYFDTDVMVKWQGAYHAKKRKQAEEAARRSSGDGGNAASAGEGTIIASNGDAPVEQCQYFIDVFR